jgi:hypothetical protein
VELDGCLRSKAGFGQNTQRLEDDDRAGCIIVGARGSRRGTTGRAVIVGTYNDWNGVGTRASVVDAGGLPRFSLVPGMRAITEGWLNECSNCVTTISGLAEATSATVSKSHWAASWPVGD